MKLYALATLASVVMCSQAFADIGEKSCQFGPITITNSFIDDVSGAPIGTEIGTVDFDITVESCDLGNGKAGQGGFYLAGQPSGTGSNWCATTLDGVQISSGIWGGTARCSTTSSPIGAIGPGLGDFRFRDETYPKRFTGQLVYQKKGQIPDGLSQLTLHDPRILFASGQVGIAYDRLVSSVAPFPAGEVIGTKCVLSSSVIPVDFGEVSSSGAHRGFEMVFSDCSGREDAVAFNNAVSIEFRSENIREDGSALLNCNSAGCAKGVQIGLKDSGGRDINLLSGIKLSTNNPSVSDDGLTHTFSAELEARVDEAIEAGKIDTQLVFETVVE